MIQFNNPQSRPYSTNFRLPVLPKRDSKCIKPFIFSERKWNKLSGTKCTALWQAFVLFVTVKPFIFFQHNFKWFKIGLNEFSESCLFWKNNGISNICHLSNKVFRNWISVICEQEKKCNYPFQLWRKSNWIYFELVVLIYLFEFTNINQL